MITIKECEDSIGIPSNKWVSRCHEIANAILDTGLAKGTSRYGLYIGPISETSHFAGCSIARHGWIELANGGILDPTRWVFEDVDPYIFICDKDDCAAEEYDIGASSIRFSSSGKPPPDYSGELIRNKQLIFPNCVDPLLEKIFGRVDLCKDQCFWLANQTPKSLGAFAEPIYKTFIDYDLGALIPIDYRHVVFGKD
jgi:hypothetical protein